MMKAEPISPRLDTRNWPRPNSYDKLNHKHKRTSRSRSRSPARNKQPKPYFANKSWVRRPSDASETSTLVASVAGGSSSASLLDRLAKAPSDQDEPSLLRRMTSPDAIPKKKSPKGKKVVSPADRTLSEAQDFADRIIQQALIEGLGTADNGTDGKAADRDSTPMDLDDIFDYVVLHSPGKDLIVKPEGRATVPSSEFISDELLSRGNVSDNKSAPLPSLIEPPYMAVASTSSSQPSPPPPSSGIPSTLQEVRQILLPVILQNALRRDPHADSEAIKRSAVDLLTDEQCLEFVRLAQETRTQLAAKEERERQRVPKQQLSSERDIGIPVDPTRIREHAPQEITSATGDMQRIQDNGWPKDRVPSASLGVVVPVLAPDEGEAGELENDSGRPKPINAGAEVETKMKGDEKDKLWDDRPRRQHSCDHNPGRGSDWDRGRGRRASNYEQRRPDKDRGRDFVEPGEYPRSRQQAPSRIDDARNLKVKREAISPSRDYFQRSISPRRGRSSQRDKSPVQGRQEADRSRDWDRRRRSRSPASRDPRPPYHPRQGEYSYHSRRYPDSPTYDRREPDKYRDSYGYRKHDDHARRPSMTSDAEDRIRRRSTTSNEDRMDVVDKHPLAAVASDTTTSPQASSPTKRPIPSMPKAMLPNRPPHSVENVVVSRAVSSREPSSDIVKGKGLVVNAQKATALGSITMEDVEMGEIVQKEGNVDVADITQLKTAGQSPSEPELAPVITLPAAQPVAVPSPTGAETISSVPAVASVSPDQPPREDPAPSESSRHSIPVMPQLSTTPDFKNVTKHQDDPGLVIDAQAHASQSLYVQQTPVVQTPVVQVPAVQIPAVQIPSVQVPTVQAPVMQAPAEQAPAVYVPPRTLVPSLWFVAVGEPLAGIINRQFFVDEEVAAAVRRWSQRDVDLDPSAPHVSTYLLCLPAAQVAEVNQNLDPRAPREAIVSALWNIETKWPSMGSVIVEVNTGDFSHNHCWLPVDLVGPLDVSDYIKPGWNSFRCIQLADASQYVFILHASLPSQEELDHLGNRATMRKNYLRPT